MFRERTKKKKKDQIKKKKEKRKKEIIVSCFLVLTSNASEKILPRTCEKSTHVVFFFYILSYWKTLFYYKSLSIEYVYVSISYMPYILGQLC